MIALLLGIGAVACYIYLFLTQAQSGTIFWTAGILSLAALVFGAFSRADRAGRIGLILGIVGIVVFVVLVLWLMF